MDRKFVWIIVATWLVAVAAYSIYDEDLDEDFEVQGDRKGKICK